MDQAIDFSTVRATPLWVSEVAEMCGFKATTSQSIKEYGAPKEKLFESSVATFKGNSIVDSADKSKRGADAYDGKHHRTPWDLETSVDLEMKAP